MLLEPLGAVESTELIRRLGDLPDELLGRIVRAAEGNPLFLEEMLALVRANGGGMVEVPPSIQALLAARLDQLDPADRAVLERGSVEGRVFHRGGIAALTDGDGQVDQRLLSLVRKELVRPEQSVFPGDDAYRFRHLLIRDAAYDALPKSVRADLHQRFAAWLEQHGQDLLELDEILGYHLERAARYLIELGSLDRSLEAEASTRLWAAGRRARWRNDPTAARSLLERAVALAEDPDVHLLVDLARSVSNPLEAAELMGAAAERFEAAGDVAASALARTLAAEYLCWAGRGSIEDHNQLALIALPMLEAANDHDGLFEVWFSLARGVYNARFQMEQIQDAVEQALRHASLAGIPAHDLGYRALAAEYGPAPVSDALDWVDAQLAVDPNPFDGFIRAVLLAMSDQFEEARAYAAPLLAHLGELGIDELSHYHLAEIDSLDGDYGNAAEHMKIVVDDVTRRGKTAHLASFAPLYARLLCGLGRFDEAWPLAMQGRELGLHDDALTQSSWRQAAALVQASRGQTHRG